MTTYYVDPVSGSNSNNGTSWGTAWKWLPGNGTTINPGDEVRIAKSAESLTDANKLLNMSNSLYAISNHASMTGCAIRNTESCLTSSWTSLHASVTSGSPVAITGSASIAANTPLAYVNTVNNPFSITTGTVLELLVVVTGVPTGAKLKFVLYSDLGITPIATLYGNTVLTSTPSNPTGLSCYAQYLYEPGGTLNLSIRQVRLFSDEAFTTESYGGRVVHIGSYFRTYEPTGTFKTWKLGQAWEHTTYDPASISGLPSMPSPKVGATFIKEHNSTPTSITANDHIKSGGSVITGTHNLQPKGYAALPFDASLYETPLTFSGTNANRITISGGWNTSSGLQDGYTNLCIAGIGMCARKAPFVFSSGGDYLTFRRILVHDAHVVYYDYAVGTINGLRLYNCSWGRMPSSFGPSGLIGVDHDSNSSITIANLLLDTCSASNGVMVSRRKAGEAVTPTEAWCPAPGNMVFGNVDIVDSVMLHFYTKNGSYPTAIKYTGYFRMYGSSTGSTTSRLGIRGYGVFTEFIDGAGASPLVFADTVLDASQNAGVSLYQGDSSVATLEVELLRVVVTGNSRSSEQKSFVVQFAKKVTIDSFKMGTNTGSYAAFFTLRWTKSWDALNASGPTLVWSGTHSVLGGMAWTSQFKIDYLIGDVSVGTFPLPLCINTWKTGARVLNGTIEAVQLAWLFPEYPSSAEGYGPSMPILDVENVIGYVQTLESVPSGSVRRIGGEQKTSSYASTVGTTCHGAQRALLNYGVTLPDIDVSTSDIVAHSGGAVSRGRSVNVNILDFSNMGATYDSSNVSTESQDIVVADSVTLPSAQALEALESSAIAIGNQCGMLLRKLSGEFLHLSGRCAAYNIPTENAYGFWPIRVLHSFHLATLDVVAGIPLVLRMRYVSVAAQNNYIVLSIPPCEAYTTTLEGHQFRKNIRASAQEYLLEVTIAPQRNGVIEVHVYAYKQVELRSFSAEPV